MAFLAIMTAKTMKATINIVKRKEKAGSPNEFKKLARIPPKSCSKPLSPHPIPVSHVILIIQD
jgi:hypothetical protein